MLFRGKLRCDHSGGATNVTHTMDTTRRTSTIIMFIKRRSVLSNRTRSLTGLGLRKTRDRLVGRLTTAKGPIIAMMVTKHRLIVTSRMGISSTILCDFRPNAVNKPTVTSVLFKGMGPDKGAPMAFPHVDKRIPVCCTRRGANHPTGPARVLVSRVPMRTKRASIKYHSFCLSTNGSPLFPFNCNLSCAAFRCDGLDLTSSGLATRSALSVDFALGGANGCSKARIIRLCMRSGIKSIAHPIGRLGHFRHIALGTKRSARMSLDLPISRLTF